MRGDSHVLGLIPLAVSCSSNPLVLVLVASILACGSRQRRSDPAQILNRCLSRCCCVRHPVIAATKRGRSSASFGHWRNRVPKRRPSTPWMTMRDSIERFLGESGVKIRADQLGFAGDFFECINEIAGNALRSAKTKFNRTRPYNIPDNGLHVLKTLKLEDSPSYPSGHAAYGTVVGLIIADMVPELRERIYERIRDYGFSRLRVGVHFRSDIYAGEMAGAAITASLYRNHEFQGAFERAKPGLRAALGY